MGKLKFPTRRDHQVSLALIVVAALLALDGLYQLGKGIQWRWWLSSVAAAAETTTTQPTTRSATDTQPTTRSATDTQPTTRSAADTQPTSKPAASPNRPKKRPEVSAAIKRRNLFAKAQPKGHGMTLVGVLVDTALLQTRTGQIIGLTEGKSGQGITLKTIDGYEVTIEHEGKTETLKLQTGGPSGGPSRPSPGRPGPRGVRMTPPPGAIRMSAPSAPSAVQREAARQAASASSDAVVAPSGAARARARR